MSAKLLKIYIFNPYSKKTCGTNLVVQTRTELLCAISASSGGALEKIQQLFSDRRKKVIQM